MPLDLPDLSHLGFTLDKTTLVIDSTKMKTFMDCPRKFFYNYILGWTAKEPNLHLEFGTAWHIGMEILLKSLKENGGYTSDAVGEAYAGFYKYLAPIFDPRLHALDMAPKSYANAMLAYGQYAQRYEREDFKVHYTEISGSIPIGPDGREMYFRIDGVCENERGMFALEHKTTTRMERNWHEQWNLSVQIGCYTHVLYCIFGKDRSWGVTVNGTVFKKTENEFARVPIYKTTQMMQVWLEIANHYYERIEEELLKLEAEHATDPTMKAFPMNTESCTKYGVCPYHDLCSVWPQPLAQLNRRPYNFTTKFWDPRDLDQNAEIVLRSGKIQQQPTEIEV